MASLMALCLLAGPATAVVFAEKNLAQLVGEAEQIFVGTVGSLQSRKLDSGAIVTDASFSDLQVLKGAAADTKITLLIAGGEVEGIKMEIPGVPRLMQGARYLVFSKGNGRDMFPVVGGSGGIFRIVPGPGGADPVVVDSSDKPLAGSIAAEVLAAGSQAGGASTGSAVALETFLNAIRAKLAGR